METDSIDSRPLKRMKTSPDPETASIVQPTCTSRDSDREGEVGITAYIYEDRPVIYGVLKKRYTDFLVNEILQNGQTLHLLKTSVDGRKNENVESNNGTSHHVEGAGTDSGQPLTSQGEQSYSKGQESEASAAVTEQSQQIIDTSEVSKEDRSTLVEYFNEKAVSELLVLYRGIQEDPKKKSRDHPVVRTEFTSDRSVRTQIHQDIRRIFNCKIDSSTDKDGILVLSAVLPNKRNIGGSKGSRTGNARPGKLGWLDLGGENILFSLCKENKDTMEVISYLARQLKVNVKTFAFAGTKDRRAVTTQRVSAYRIEAGRLAAQNKNLRNAAIGDFEYHKNGLELGDLAGNEFLITIREITLRDEAEVGASDRVDRICHSLTRSLRDLRERGCLNYFGLQRFGTFATRTDAVGVFLLKGDFEGACNAILDFNPNALIANENLSIRVGEDDRARAEAIQLWRMTQHANEAFNKLPRKFSAEAALLRHLGKNPKDFLGALMTIPRNLRLMYVHAYQSLIWNLAVSERWRLFGDKVIEGDLVLVNEHKDKTEEPAPHVVDVDGEIVVQAAIDDRAQAASDIFERARALTAEEAVSGTYTIFDVVLPLPGYDVLYPENASGKFYETIMATERGGELDPHDMRRPNRDFSLSGGYRKMIARIGRDYSVDVHQYDNEDQQFVQTDMDRLNASQQVETAKEEKSDGRRAGQKVAAVIKMQLGPSQYATIVLRELSRGGIQAHKPDFGGGR